MKMMMMRQLTGSKEYVGKDITATTLTIVCLLTDYIPYYYVWSWIDSGRTFSPLSFILCLTFVSIKEEILR